MRTCQATEKLGIAQSTLDCAYINPLRLLISEEFDRPIGGEYRERAVKRAIKSGISFVSEINSIGILVSKLIVVKCPVCGRAMTNNSNGGSMQEVCFTYECEKCDIKIQLNLNGDSISVDRKEDEDSPDRLSSKCLLNEEERIAAKKRRRQHGKH